MILNRRINLIWYGRGNIENECVAFALHNVTEVSNAISDVYCVTDGGSSNTFQENTWKTSKPSQLAGFTELKCGNLYVVVLNDGATIDIPEAVVVYGGESVNPADIVSVLPNNDGGTNPGPDPEPPTGICGPVGHDEIVVIAGSGDAYNANFNHKTNSQISAVATITPTAGMVDSASDIKFYFPTSMLTKNDSLGSYTFSLDDSEIMSMDTEINLAGADFYISINSVVPAFSGCYKTTGNISGPDPYPIEKVGETDERTPTPSPSHTVTPDVPVDAQATCFADNAAEYKMVYEAASNATAETLVTTDNVKVYKKGSADALGDAGSNNSDLAATMLRDEMIGKAASDDANSKHSFCIWFNVELVDNANDPNDDVILSATSTGNGITTGDTLVVANGTLVKDLNNGSNKYGKFVLVNTPKIYVNSETPSCVTTSDDGDGVVSFNF